MSAKASEAKTTTSFRNMSSGRQETSIGQTLHYTIFLKLKNCSVSIVVGLYIVNINLN